MGGLGITSFCTGLWKDFVVCYQRKQHGQSSQCCFFQLQELEDHVECKAEFILRILVSATIKTGNGNKTGSE